MSGQTVGNDFAAQIRATKGHASETIDSRRREISQEQGTLSEDYNATVKSGKVSRHHGGNQAVWDTVGAQTDNRAKLGTPTDRPSIGEWHLDNDGVPVPGPKPDTPESATSAAKAEQPAEPKEARRRPDGKGTSGNR